MFLEPLPNMSVGSSKVKPVLRVSQKGISKPQEITKPTLIGKSICEAIAKHKAKQKVITLKRPAREKKISKGNKDSSMQNDDGNCVCICLFQPQFSRISFMNSSF